MTQQKISIIGDSFGCGEWNISNGKPVVVHTGTQQYLIEHGFDVKNFSYGGASSKSIINQILDNDIHDQTLIVFATDSLRGYREQDEILKKLYLVKNYSIKHTHKLIFTEWIKNLSQITENRQCQVVLIGGHANLYDIDYPKNFKICHYSWLSDICNQKIGNLAGIDSGSIETFITLKNIQSDQDKQEIIDVMTQRSNRLNLMFNKANLFPDHLHPDRKCHKILAEKIVGLIG